MDADVNSTREGDVRRVTYFNILDFSLIKPLTMTQNSIHMDYMWFFLLPLKKDGLWCMVLQIIYVRTSKNRNMLPYIPTDNRTVYYSSY